MMQGKLREFALQSGPHFSPGGQWLVHKHLMSMKNVQHYNRVQ
jgi:hypothetical protein